MESGSHLRLTRILMYPLKGAAGFDLRESGVDETGIPGDRRWMLAKPDGGFISQRTHPRLCLVRTAPPRLGGSAKALDLSVSAPGMENVYIPAPANGSWMEVQVHRDRFRAWVGFAEADQWFSDLLGEPCRLVFLPSEVRRPCDRKYAPGFRVSLADGYPLHLTTVESLQEMNRVLSQDTDMLRYRPNLVLEGCEPWAEDEWRVLETGGITLRVVKPCARCRVITVNQRTAEVGKEPLSGLRDFREWEGKVYFGQNAVFEGNGRFRVGEDVRILEKGHRRPPIRPEGPTA